jgi:hypothetical protein
MTAAFGCGKPAHTNRLIPNFPRLDRATLTRSGALQPGMRTSWVVRDPKGASAIHIELAAAPDGLTISTGDQVQVVRYRYDAMPNGGIKILFLCPSCERICWKLYLDDGRWGCWVCLGLKHPSKVVHGRVMAVYLIEELRRNLARTQPGSLQARRLRARIVELHAILSSDVARVRRDLRRRLKTDYRR